MTAAKPETASVVYVGPAAQGVFCREFYFPNGEPVEVPADLAASLLEQDTFTQPKSKKEAN
jgi:hypothetical protein